MKRYLLLIIGTCLVMACKRSEQLPSRLFGKWELRRSYGGLSYRDSTYKSGNGSVYQFNSDSTYKRFNKSGMIEQGTFHIKKEEFSPGEFVNAIAFTDRSDWEVFNFSGTKLTIGTIKNDNIAEDYEKLGD